MKRLFSAMLLAALVMPGGPAFAKAKTVAVYAVHSQESDDVSTRVATTLAVKIDNLPGYAAKFQSSAAGSLGEATKAAGADLYVLVQAQNYDDGSEIAIVTPYSTDDEPLGPSDRVRMVDWSWPSDFDAATIFQSAGMPLASDGHTVMVTGGTPVVVSMLETVSSASAKPDDTFAFKADEDVICNGFVVIRKGSPGQGTIESVDGAASNGHAGTLSLRFDYIMSADGLKIPLSDTDRTDEGQEKKGAASTATILGYAFLGVGGLFMHNFVRGGQMQIEPSKRLTVYVDHNVHVAAADTADGAAYAK